MEKRGSHGLAHVLRIAIGALALASGAPAAAQQAPAEALTLPEVVRSALARSRDIRQARYALDEAEERVAEAWGSVYPDVNVSASYIRNVSVPVNFLPAIFVDPNAGPDDLIPMKFGADNIWASAVDVDQPLFNARSFIGVGAAGRYRALQGEVLRSRTQAVVTRVRMRYYGLLLAQEQARLTENSVRRVREGLEQARALNRAGLTSEYDVLRLEVEVANLEPNLRRAVNAVTQARRQLAVELDLENADSVRVAGSLATMELDDLAANSAENRAILEFGGVPGTTIDLDALATGAMSARSDLRQLELTENLRRTELRLEQVEYFPTVSVFGSYTINAQQSGSPDFFGSPRAYGRTVGVRVSLPIFNGFERESRIDQKRAALRAAESQSRLATDQAQADVKTLAEQAEEALLRARGQRLAVKQAGRGFEIVSAQHREGLSSQLELTDAEVALRQSEFNYAQAVYDWLATRARLDEAMGRVPMVDGEGAFE
jgi:outer membrane protein TolC